MSDHLERAKAAAQAAFWENPVGAVRDQDGAMERAVQAAVRTLLDPLKPKRNPDPDADPAHYEGAFDLWTEIRRRAGLEA